MRHDGDGICRPTNALRVMNRRAGPLHARQPRRIPPNRLGGSIHRCCGLSEGHGSSARREEQVERTLGHHGPLRGKRACNDTRGARDDQRESRARSGPSGFFAAVRSHDCFRIPSTGFSGHSTTWMPVA